MKERTNLARAGIGLLVVMLLLVGYAFSKDKEPAVITVQGEIVDSQCAFNVHSMDHSHESMIKKGVYGRDSRSCTLHCAKEMGGVFVLVGKKDLYRLDDQTLAEQFAGKKVKVTGTVDSKGDTLHVLKMEEDVSPSSDKATSKP
ncbi:MAG TPA: DUF5818 domain-containing protein [Candidatus Angelobacter sp.]